MNLVDNSRKESRKETADTNVRLLLYNKLKDKISSRQSDQGNLEIDNNRLRLPRQTLSNYTNARNEAESKNECTNSTIHKNKSSNNIQATRTDKNVNSKRKIIIKNLVPIDVDDEISEIEFNDTAYLIMPSMSDENVDITYRYMMSDDRVRQFIIKGEMLDIEVVDPYDPKEIDEILDDIFLFDVRYYLVKWKNWSKGFYTWECFNVLFKSQKVLYDYLLKRKKDTNKYKPINGMRIMLSRGVISKLFDLFRTEVGLTLPLITPEDISGMFNSLDVGSESFQTIQLKSMKLYLAIVSMSGFRQQQLLALKQWEIDINVVTRGYHIKVENNMDLEGPPACFVYITEYLPRENICIPNDPPIGCVCKKNCQNSKDCCNEMSGYSGVYDANKNITVAPGCPIYECNRKCKCNKNCNNRVVQLGSKVNICIYRTKKCGWGVKTSENIKKGQFIATYVGEIITVKESEKRLEKGTSFLEHMWNLDFDDQQNYKYIIDGSKYANFTYFINHSCNSNLNVYAVWINCLDRNLPQLALFASRDILAGEQLTTNYFYRVSKGSPLKTSGTKCQCNMKNCKGYYF